MLQYDKTAAAPQPVPLTRQLVLGWLPKRAPEAHKGSYGQVLAVAGSAGYRGAAALAAEGALRAGAGIVTLASVEPVIAGVQARLPECCFAPCAANAQGGIAAGNCAALCARLRPGSVLLAGPGLGNTADTGALVAGLLAAAPGPVVLDADALNALAGQFAAGTAPRPAQGGPLILTPHPGEMARLTGLTVAGIQAAPAAVAAAFVRAHGCVLVLKGHRTLVAAPDAANGVQLWRNTTGNPGLARGGSGDILAGMVAGLAACGLPAAQAAAAAVWLHGAAADDTAARLGQYGMLPHDIFPALGAIFAAAGL